MRARHPTPPSVNRPVGGARSSKIGPPPGRERGYFLSSVNLVLIAVLLVVLIFSLRLLIRPGPAEARLSDRYHELNGRDDLTAAERAEFEVEKCRFRRDLLARYEKEKHPRLEAAEAEYRKSCAHRLPR